jgi:uncharacterized hydrophobic protein (TIGR00271 family)
MTETKKTKKAKKVTSKKKEEKKEFLKIDKSEQYRTVEELMDKGRPSPVYYTLLTLSSIIVSAGLLVSNAAIVIGGMLVTPILTPILLISLGVSVGDVVFTKKTSLFVGKSLLVILLSGFLLGILFDLNGEPSFFPLDNTLRGAVLYFVVALASGFAATFAWVRKEINEILPGIAVAVALVPPLALVGLGLSVFMIEVIRYNFFVFFFNLLGVLVGSLLVFSVLKFYKIEKKVEQEAEKQENGK